MRYLGQNYETEVEIPTAVSGESTLQEAYEAFHRMHEAIYGYRIPNAVIELISFKVTVVGSIPKPRLRPIETVEEEPGLNNCFDRGLFPLEAV